MAPQPPMCSVNGPYVWLRRVGHHALSEDPDVVRQVHVRSREHRIAIERQLRDDERLVLLQGVVAIELAPNEFVGVRELAVVPVVGRGL